MPPARHITARRPIVAILAATAAAIMLTPGFDAASAQGRTAGNPITAAPPAIRRIRDLGGRTLVRTESARGTGLTWVPTRVFDGLKAPSELTESELATLRGLAESGRHADVVRMAGPLLARHPEHPTLRRVMAAALRNQWAFAASSTIYEDLCREADEASRIDKTKPADLTLMMEAAEAATLLGEKRVWDPAIRRYRRHARALKDKTHEARSEAIERHAEGKAIEVFAAGMPPHRDAPALAKERAAVDRRKSTHAAGIPAVTRMLALLAARGGLDAAAEVVLTPIDKETEERYLAGGPESVFCGRVKLARGAVTVNRSAWLALWDHEKHEELYGLGYVLRQRFPGADVNVAVYVPSATPGRPPQLAASIRIPYAKSPILELLTDQRWDPMRDSAIIKEQADAEDQWKGRAR